MSRFDTSRKQQQDKLSATTKTPSYATQQAESQGIHTSNLSHSAIQQLQRSVGNQQMIGLLQRRGQLPAQTVQSTSSPVIQRDIRVNNVDFDPNENEYRHQFIRVNEFINQVFTLIQQDNANFAGAYQNHRNNVRGDFRDHATDEGVHDYEQPDFPTLIPAIRNAIIGFYTDRHVLAWSQLRQDTLDRYIETALIANIIPSNHPMTGGEAGAFDDLIIRARQHGSVSKAKGTASVIPVGSLPEGLGNRIALVRASINNERARWTVAGFRPEYVFGAGGDGIVPQFNAAVWGGPGEAYYQGNHTNNAGWLPTIAIPTPLEDMRANILTNSNGNKSVRRLMREGYANILPQHQGFNLQHLMPLYNQYLQPLNDNDIEQMAMNVYGAGISTYIEFNMGGDISRVVYESTTDTIYVTAHYKGKDGYNPFFRVTGA